MKNIIKYTFVTLIVLCAILEIGEKYQFNPYSTKFKNYSFIGIRFTDYELYSNVTYQGDSWLRIILDKHGYDRYQDVDHWLDYGILIKYGFMTTRNFELNKDLRDLLDSKGEISSNFYWLIKENKKKKAFDIYESELVKLQK